MVVACSYKILWPKIDFLHILACFGPFLECKKAQNWNGLPGHVYGSINLKFFWGLPRPICNYPPNGQAEIQFFFWPRLLYTLTIVWYDMLALSKIFAFFDFLCCCRHLCNVCRLVTLVSCVFIKYLIAAYIALLVLPPIWTSMLFVKGTIMAPLFFLICIAFEFLGQLNFKFDWLICYGIN